MVDLYRAPSDDLFGTVGGDLLTVGGTEKADSICRSLLLKALLRTVDRGLPQPKSKPVVAGVSHHAPAARVELEATNTRRPVIGEPADGQGAKRNYSQMTLPFKPSGDTAGIGAIDASSVGTARGGSANGPPVLAGWACSRCTFNNASQSESCKICDLGTRPAATTGVRAPNVINSIEIIEIDDSDSDEAVDNRNEIIEIDDSDSNRETAQGCVDYFQLAEGIESSGDHANAQDVTEQLGQLKLEHADTLDDLGHAGNLGETVRRVLVARRSASWREAKGMSIYLAAAAKRGDPNPTEPICLPAGTHCPACGDALGNRVIVNIELYTFQGCTRPTIRFYHNTCGSEPFITDATKRAAVLATVPDGEGGDELEKAIVERMVLAVDRFNCDLAKQKGMKKGAASKPFVLPAFVTVPKGPQADDIIVAENGEEIVRGCLRCGQQKPGGNRWKKGPKGPRTLCNCCGMRFYQGLPFTRPQRV